MAVSKAQQRAVTKYDAKAYDKTLLRLPKGRLDVVKDHASARGESVNGFIGRAISETMERDGVGKPAEGPQEAAGATAGAGTLVIPPDKLEAIQKCAKEHGETLWDFALKSMRMRIKAETSPQEALQAPPGAGAVSLPSDALETAQRAAETAGEALPSGTLGAAQTPAKAAKQNLHSICALLNEGEKRAYSRGRSKESDYGESILLDLFEAGYTVEEVTAAAERAAQEGFKGSWFGFPEYCAKIYGRTWKQK